MGTTFETVRFCSNAPAGPYNRVLGEIFVDGVNVNLAMVKAGYDEVYRGRPPKGFNTDPYIKAEELARRSKKGIWSQAGRVSPKMWRKMHKECTLP